MLSPLLRPWPRARVGSSVLALGIVRGDRVGARIVVRPRFPGICLRPAAALTLRYAASATGRGPSDSSDLSRNLSRDLPRENIYNIPNAITSLRIVAAPFIGYLIASGSHPLALSCLAAAAVSDVVDGYVARSWNLKTRFGSVLDPAADKILMTTLTVSLMQAGLLSREFSAIFSNYEMKSKLSSKVPLGSLIIARDIGLVIGAMVYRYRSLPEPVRKKFFNFWMTFFSKKTWNRYWDVSLPSAEVNPPLISKLNTFLQLLLMYSSLAASVYGLPPDHVVLDALRWTVLGTTIASAGSYWFGNNVKFL
ncbi:hypothetical protein HDU83_002126 [Entophlyctis luteolus]|nr:hypothetical protein HDU83_002126 [Entophlyctis luteolus]